MSFMSELNPTDSLELLEEEGCDTLTVIDLGSEISLSQVSDGGADFHNVIMGLEQARALMGYLEKLFAPKH